MKFILMFFLAMSFCISYAGNAQKKSTLLFRDQVRMELPDDPFIANTNCGGFRVVMEANSRNTQVARITFLDEFGAQKKRVTLSEDICYGYLSCFGRDGDEILVVMADEACGGNALEPSYVTINTSTFLQNLMDSPEARKFGID